MSGFITHRNFDLKDTPSLKDKVAVCTGGNAGLGREIVAQLLAHDISKVYVLARSSKKFQDAIASWTERKLGDVESRVEFITCDLGDVTVVKKVADELMQKLDRLDMLFNHAGLPPMKEYTLSPQGIETIFATNVVGAFVLTNILVPILESTAVQYGNSRIVTTASSLHMGCQELKLDLIMSPTPVKSPAAVDSVWRYARSKLGSILFTRELAHWLDKRGSSNVYANCFFPGNVPTDAMDSWKDLLGTIAGGTVKGVFKIIGQSPADAAATALYLASSPDVESKDQKGKYFVPIATEHSPSKIAEDKDLAKNLWYWCDDKATKALGLDWIETSVLDRRRFK